MGNERESPKIDPQALWAKYEDIAMHFNDLLMRLRTQSLAAIAAISTLVSIFANHRDADASIDWLVAAGLFSAMSIIWIAIFCLDFFYYNRLLNGAVSALTALEGAIGAGSAVGINLSTMIEEEFAEGRKANAATGVLFFYGIVFAFLIVGSGFFLRTGYVEGRKTPPSAISSALTAPACAVCSPPVAQK